MASSDFLWWRDGVVYQIYPRSFADENGDGIGDLRGLIEKLDYLNDGAGGGLGIDAIWLSPIYPSPMHDFGYDVSNYSAIGPEFGTMADFDELLAEAHRRNIRIILDLVMNHCSSEHPWFREARSSRGSDKRDWFIFHDGKAGGKEPPNNWLAMFGGRAWEWDEATGQYYLHTFLKEQPDLNWRNPELREAMKQMMRFWLEKGVDGFRLDVVNWFVKDEKLRDNPLKELRRRVGKRAYDQQIHQYDRNRPETIDVVKEIRGVLDEYDERMAVGEVYVEPFGDPELPAEYYADGEGLHLAFNFPFLYSPWKAEAFAHAIDRWESLLWPNLWPNYTLSNHDQPRAFSRFDDGTHSEARARVAAVMLLTLRGTPFLYYGEEIGMKSGRIPRSRIQDPLGKRYWPFNPGRDPARTPMQWSSAPQAGFSKAEPWLPVNADFRRVNVEAQQQSERSLLSFYKTLIALRKREVTLRRGQYRRLVQRSPDVLAYAREHDGERIVVALNFASEPRPFRPPAGLGWRLLVDESGPAEGLLPEASHDLSPHGVIVAKAERARSS